MVHSITFVKGEVIPRYDETDGRVHFTDKVNGEYPNERRTDVDWGLVPSNASFVQAPEPKEYILEVDGIDNDGIDYSDAVTGRTLYKSRQGEWKFYRQAQHNWSVGLPEIVNWLQGKKVSVITDDDPSYYYVGRITVSLESNEYWATVTMKYKLEAYKKYVYPSYQLDITGRDPVTLKPFDKKIYPVVWDLIDFEDAHYENTVITKLDYYNTQPYSWETPIGIRRTLYPGTTSPICQDLVLYLNNGVIVRQPNPSSVVKSSGSNETMYFDSEGRHTIVKVETDSGDEYHRGTAVKPFLYNSDGSFRSNVVNNWYLVYATKHTSSGDLHAKVICYLTDAPYGGDARLQTSGDDVLIGYTSVLTDLYVVESIRTLSTMNAITVSDSGALIIQKGTSVFYLQGSGSGTITLNEDMSCYLYVGDNFVVFSSSGQRVGRVDVSDTDNFDTSNIVLKMDDMEKKIESFSSHKIEIPTTEKPIVPRISVNCPGVFEDPDLTTMPYFMLVNAETGDEFVSQRLNNYEAYQLKPGVYNLRKLVQTPNKDQGMLLDWRKEKL